MLLIDDYRRHGSNWVIDETVTVDVPTHGAKRLVDMIPPDFLKSGRVRFDNDGNINVVGAKATEQLWHAVVLGTVAEGQVMVMDNIVRHISETMTDVPVPRELPVCVPPFPVVWAEYHVPKQSNIEIFRVMADTGAEGVAVLFESMDLFETYDTGRNKRALRRALKEEADQGNYSAESILDVIETTSADIRWQTRMSVYVKFRGKPGLTGPVGVLNAYFDADGRLGSTDYLKPAKTLIESVGIALAPEVPRPDAMKDFYLMVMPILYGFGFAHCKNVSMTDIEPNPKVQRAVRRRGHPELITYKMLVINPDMGGNRSKRAYVEGSDEHRKSAHIVRGHFAWYGPGHPDGQDRGLLFGKHAGQFWVPGHSRGQLSIGAVVKDYAVTSGGNRA